MSGAKMYRDILTICWSIREVNKNLSDRKSTVDFSIKYLNKACLKLSESIRDLSKEMPNEAIDAVNEKGQKIKLSLNDISDMLQDPKKILEYHLIDLIDGWARTKAEKWPI
ncbi:MAG: hypothetical protein MUO26_01470 [Methanotrichaceae archaeon]|nr:hypothetical protein [Methanotrichaceae archaeon]